jgi:hypothetical protein
MKLFHSLIAKISVEKNGVMWVTEEDNLSLMFVA